MSINDVQIHIEKLRKNSERLYELEKRQANVIESRITYLENQMEVIRE